MGLKDGLIAELQYDATLTRKLLDRIPEEHYSWKPHEKSFSLGALSSHVVHLLSWIPAILTKNETDISQVNENPRAPFATKAEMLAAFDRKVSRGLEELEKAEESSLNDLWILRHKEHVIFTIPRKVSLRNMVYNHTVHHRGQLTVYLRLLNVPVPALYGPSADEAV